MLPWRGCETPSPAFQGLTKHHVVVCRDGRRLHRVLLNRGSGGEGGGCHGAGRTPLQTPLSQPTGHALSAAVGHQGGCGRRQSSERCPGRGQTSLECRVWLPWGPWHCWEQGVSTYSWVCHPVGGGEEPPAWPAHPRENQFLPPGWERTFVLRENGCEVGTMGCSCVPTPRTRPVPPGRGSCPSSSRHRWW